MNSISSLILAGGNSERMGEPKSLLKFGNSTFLEKIIFEYLSAGINKIFVVLNNQLIDHPIITKIKKVTGENVEFISNYYPGEGRFLSIKKGIKKAGNFTFCFIQNSDNPFVNSDLILQLILEKNYMGYTIPVYEGKGGHPILISGSIIRAISETKNKETNLRDLLRNFSKKEVAVKSKEILCNINTREDYFAWVNGSINEKHL